jgi:hypothetical protein
MTSDEDSKNIEAQVNILTAILDEHRDTISSLPGVQRSGIGFSELGDPEQIIIQIYIYSKMHFEELERKLKDIFRGYPVEVIYHDQIPDSQQDSGEMEDCNG